MSKDTSVVWRGTRRANSCSARHTTRQSFAGTSAVKRAPRTTSKATRTACTRSCLCLLVVHLAWVVSRNSSRVNSSQARTIKCLSCGTWTPKDRRIRSGAKRTLANTVSDPFSGTSSRCIYEQKKKESISWLVNLKAFFFQLIKSRWATKTVGKRQHHCRRCGAAACDDCTKARSSIPVLGHEFQVRICCKCISAISDDEWVFNQLFINLLVQ